MKTCRFARAHTETFLCLWSHSNRHTDACTHRHTRFLSNTHHVHSHTLTISLSCELILVPPPQPLCVPHTHTHSHVPSITNDSCLLYVIPSNQTEFHKPIKLKVVFFYLVILSPLHQSQTFSHNQALHPHLLVHCIIRVTHHRSSAQTHIAHLYLTQKLQPLSVLTMIICRKCFQDQNTAYGQYWR